MEPLTTDAAACKGETQNIVMVSQVVFESEVIFSALGVEYVRINIHSLTTSFGTPVWLLIYSQSQDFFLHDRVYVYRERSEKGENTGHVSSSSRLDQGLLSKYRRLQFTRTHQNRTTEVCQNTLMSHFYYNIQMIVSEFQHMDQPWPAAVVQALCAGVKVWAFSSLSTNWASFTHHSLPGYCCWPGLIVFWWCRLSHRATKLKSPQTAFLTSLHSVHCGAAVESANRANLWRLFAAAGWCKSATQH